MATRKAVRKLSAMRSARGTCTWNLVMGWKIGSWFVSWNPSLPRSDVIADGVMTMTGEWACHAAAMAVTMLVMPGPFWPVQTLVMPVTRA